jgi:hypothetical protein
MWGWEEGFRLALFSLGAWSVGWSTDQLLAGRPDSKQRPGLAAGAPETKYPPEKTPSPIKVAHPPVRSEMARGSKNWALVLSYLDVSTEGMPPTGGNKRQR